MCPCGDVTSLYMKKISSVAEGKRKTPPLLSFMGES